MADYHIYLHNGGGIGGGLAQKFAPNSQGGGDDDTSPAKKFISTTQKVASVVKSADSIIGSTINKVANAIPIVAIIKAVIDLAWLCAEKPGQLETRYWQTSTMSTNVANVRNVIGWFTHPISTATNLVKEREARDEHNRESERNEVLIGNSTLKNTITGA
jgi:hypothetical protein